MKLAATKIILKNFGDRNESFNQFTEEAFDFADAYSYILGRFAKISSFYHKNLCKFFELTKCQTVSGFIVISEHSSNQYIHHDLFLNNRIGIFDQNSTFTIAFQLICAVEYCHSKHIAIRTLDLKNVLLVDSNCKNSQKIQVKLTQCGISYITGDYFNEIQPSLCAETYQAPEYFFDAIPKGDQSAYFRTDIWSIGIMLIEMFSGWRLCEIFGQQQFLSTLMTIICKVKSGSICSELLSIMGKQCPAFEKKRIAMERICPIIEKCLNINPLERPTAKEILDMFHEIAGNMIVVENKPNMAHSIFEGIEAMKKRIKNESELERYGFNDANLNELYFLWKLCGSNVENIMIRQGVIKMQPPLSTIPSQHYGDDDKSKLYSPITLYELPINNLLERLRSIPYDKLTLSFELKKHLMEENDLIDVQAFNQSLVVKERNIDYQYQRMHLFRRLLSAWPNKAELLREESRIDIPPVYRGAVWAALLGFLPFEEDQREQIFYGLDSLSEHISDRQLQVDIPRCHQYDELMSSPMAHYQMKMLLKAVLVSRKDEFVYWQGLDSLSAPFLILHFNDLPTAYRCLNAFIDCYLHGFFLKDNSTVIRNYLAEFMRVIEFCDSELFLHLISLDFHPELFAIPWFLTCFAHVLPLHKLFHLWDALLLADAEFPLFIGVAILLQFRSKLITASFNEAILLFSDLPDLQIDNVVNTAKLYYNKWRIAEN